MKKLVIGILAHVDAGKTTLSEELLYLCGEIRKIGRVDHGDAFLDTYELEKERGITIFSKQALLKTENMEVTLLDTPGHVDFSAEMERTLQVLDYAILVINGMDGVQSHTMTLWRLLERYQIPMFLFVNKMDQQGTDHDALLNDLKQHLHENCVDFGRTQDTDYGMYELTPEQLENIAVCEEDLLETYLETDIVEDRDIVRLIIQRKIFPCYFGSALKEKGVKDFWNGVQKYTVESKRPTEFGAKVFKIARDEQGNRLTYMKITGGSLKVKTLLSSNLNGQSLPGRKAEEAAWEEKADQIRLYSGAKYELTSEAEAGTVCAVTGLTRTYPGEGLGIEQESELPILEPVLNYQIILPDDCDPHQMLQKLRQLEEEEPQLHILWDSQFSEIHAQLMGEVQIEILKKLIWDRFHVAVEFGAGSIVYKETVAEPVEGVGHFEPLRHYAEVHLLIEPGEPGSGCQFFTACSEDVLARNWQRLILTHLEEKEHIGVLTGSPLTDVQITILTGRAHAKHTEGGDFRQATYRAVRQGLRKARNILLEPYYEFRLEVPAEMIGRAMADVQKMQGTFDAPEVEGKTAILKGTAAVAQMRDYQKEVVSYTHGTGKLFCSLKGYAPCKNQDEVVQNIGYDPEADLENPTGSVFCAHGAGFVVPWDQVEAYMHLQSGVDMDELDSESWYEDVESAQNLGTAVDNANISRNISGKNGKFSYSGSYEEAEELQAIFERTFGPMKRDRTAFQKKTVHSSTPAIRYRAGKPRQEEYLLVDGYNIIFSWEELNELAKENIHAACDKLMDILSNYQGYRKCTLILVFDAYKVEGHAEEVIPYHNIYVVYTKEAETADQYIEKTVHRIGRQYQVTVATSDGLEQVIIMGQGAHRISARGLKKEIEDTEKTAREEWHQRRQSSKTYLFDHMSEEMQEQMEKIRLGENK
ncbi:translation factor GTPase family protein [Blautia obeum]|uniref:translation factor GTPase family protein n=1 Tax=Blautia obeum TaxID=40520 RepID=UPI00156D8FD1|nr:TetM/TetW/TetO/TetS family tetracycline resistance ribosomal protection protein [Blautia obeum]NSG06055.1 GTP-binding protein [Blautia obeum]NSG27392.1 GTP-binding protein [Blautia obeum]